MKKQKLESRWLNAALATLCVVLMAGCAARRGYNQADRTGEAINTVRNDVVNIKTSVDASLKSLDALATSASTDPRKPYEAFAKSVDKVDKAAKTAEKNADEMRERGAAYFQQWEAQLGSVKNEDIRKLAQQRRAKLQEIFGNIKTAAQDAKQSFPPFLDDLKDLRTALGTDLTVQGIDAAKSSLKKTKSAGLEVQKHLDALIAELNSVVAAITAAKAAPKP